MTSPLLQERSGTKSEYGRCRAVNKFSHELSIAEGIKQGALLLERMRQRWPAAFEVAKPLKLGIRADLEAAGVSAQDADAFLTWFVQTPAYLKAQAEPGAQRYDLDGVAVGTVTEQEARYAAQMILNQPSQNFRPRLTSVCTGRPRPA